MESSPQSRSPPRTRLRNSVTTPLLTIPLLPIADVTSNISLPIASSISPRLNPILSSNSRKASNRGFVLKLPENQSITGRKKSNSIDGPIAPNVSHLMVSAISPILSPILSSNSPKANKVLVLMLPENQSISGRKKSNSIDSPISPKISSSITSVVSPRLSPILSTNSPKVSNKVLVLMLPENQSITDKKASASVDSLNAYNVPLVISTSPPQENRRGSLLLSPERHSKRSNTNLLASSESQINLSTEQDNKNKLLIRRSSVSLPEVVQISSGVKVFKIFDGVKVFPKEKIKARIIMFEHKKQFSENLISSCIEIVSYIYEFETVDVPRIYATSSKIFPRLKNKLMVKGSHHAQESTVSYMFSRISFLNQSVGRKKKFKIYLEYKNDELANDFEYDVGVECEGKKYLGFLPSMEHIKDDFRETGGIGLSHAEREWNKKLNQFRSDKMECSTAILIASGLSNSTADSFATIMHSYKFFFGRRRWCKAIRKVILQNSVKMMTSRLDNLHMKRLSRELSIHRKAVLAAASITSLGMNSEDDNLIDKNISSFIQLPSMAKIQQGKKSFSSLFNGDISDEDIPDSRPRRNSEAPSLPSRKDSQDVCDTGESSKLPRRRASYENSRTKSAKITALAPITRQRISISIFLKNSKKRVNNSRKSSLSNGDAIQYNDAYVETVTESAKQLYDYVQKSCDSNYYDDNSDVSGPSVGNGGNDSSNYFINQGSYLPLIGDDSHLTNDENDEV